MTQTKMFFHITKQPFRPLQSASVIELFFDLVFIFCMRNIVPVLTEAETLNWYTYYTFGFTFLLMLQIWCHTTLIMNRYGTGDTIDRTSLVLVMFFLFLMTHAISTNWENFMVYNLSWVAILCILVGHWFAKLRTMPHLDSGDHYVMHRAMTVLALQAVLVLISLPLPKFYAEIVCAIAVLVGFGSWGIAGAYQKKAANFRHLSERCMLLVILTFGETLVSLGPLISFDTSLSTGVCMFIVIIALFFIFLNMSELSIDRDRKTSGVGFLAITVCLVFLLANINAGLDFYTSQRSFFIDTETYLALSVALFMLTVLAFTPYCKTRKAITKEWLALRILFNVLVLVCPLLADNAVMDLRLDVFAGVIPTLGVFILDRYLIFKRLPSYEFAAEKKNS